MVFPTIVRETSPTIKSLAVFSNKIINKFLPPKKKTKKKTPYTPWISKIKVRLPNPLRRFLSTMPKCAARSISSSRRLALSQGRINLISDSSESLGGFNPVPVSRCFPKWYGEVVGNFSVTKTRPSICDGEIGVVVWAAGISFHSTSSIAERSKTDKPQNVSNLKCSDFVWFCYISQTSSCSSHFPTLKGVEWHGLSRLVVKNAAPSWYQLTLKDPSISVFSF